MNNCFEIAGFLALFVLIRILVKHSTEYERLPFLDIEHLIHYCYFTSGYIVAKYGLLNKVFYNIFCSISIVIFGTLYTLTQRMPEINIPLSGRIIPFVAIYAVVYFLKIYLNDNSAVAKAFNYLGCHSLEIYILHAFFLLKLPVVGEIIHGLSGNGGHNNIGFGNLCLFCFVSL